MGIPRVVLDSNVIVSAMRSQRGASNRLLELIGTRRFEFFLSISLVLEYEDALSRLMGELDVTQTDIRDLVDYLCTEGHHQQIHYLWRPLLSDPKDDHVAELAFAASCESIMTFNISDFRKIATLGIRVMTPKDFLYELGALS